MQPKGIHRTTLYKLQKELSNKGWLNASRHYGIDPDINPSELLKKGFIAVSEDLMKCWKEV